MDRHPLGVHGATMTHVVDQPTDTTGCRNRPARCPGGRLLIAAPIQGLQDEVSQLDLPVLDGAAKRRGLAAVFLTVAVKRVEAFAHLGLEACDLLAEGVDGFTMSDDLDLVTAGPTGESAHRGQHGWVIGT